jgi:type II secretory pathway pseudopilin PulG
MNTMLSSPSLTILRARGRRLGMTLREITFVLLIMVAIIGGALVKASSTMNQSNSVQETQTVTNLAGAIRKVKMVNGYPADAEIGPAMSNLGFIPANVTHTNGTNIKNSWGGDITFHRQDGGGNFGITYTNVPTQECRQLVLGVKAGLLQSVGSGASTASAAAYNIRDLTPAIVNTNICTGASVSTINWSSAIR